mmetsp:Transcript_34557/g.53942  ORF Transcript_34557/g.53942 Transcript_34557/m.53942 type:complete len:237 (-) Transcript_34557:988-1698(-)
MSLSLYIDMLLSKAGSMPWVPGFASLLSRLPATAALITSPLSILSPLSPVRLPFLTLWCPSRFFVNRNRPVVIPIQSHADVSVPLPGKSGARIRSIVPFYAELIRGTTFLMLASPLPLRRLFLGRSKSSPIPNFGIGPQFHVLSNGRVIPNSVVSPKFSSMTKRRPFPQSVFRPKRRSGPQNRVRSELILIGKCGAPAKHCPFPKLVLRTKPGLVPKLRLPVEAVLVPKLVRFPEL